MNQFDTKMTELADAIKVKNENAAAKLSIAGMIEAVNGIEVGGGGDSNIAYGVLDADGNFQALDLSGETPADSGTAESISELVMYQTGHDEPAYPSGGGGGTSSIEFYECATYTPNADSYTKYTLPLTSAPDANANTNYVRTKWVEDATGDSENYITTAQWTAENGYKITEESGWGEFSYNIKNANGNTIYGTNMPLSERVTDYNTIPWVDYDTYESVTLTFGTVVTEEIPATTEGWTGYPVTQNPETGAWSKSDALTEGLTVQHLVPRVGEIYSADTSIRVRKMYDGSVYPITSDGLVFYAPLQTDYVDMVSGEAAIVTDGAFTEYNGLSCLKLDGFGYVKWADNSDLPSGTSAASLVLLVAPINQSDWRTYMSVGQEGEGHIDLSAKNGHFREWGGDYIQVNEWQSLIATRDDNASGKAYLNGKLNGSGSVGPSPSRPSCVCVGSNMHEGYIYKAKSYVAFAAVYNRELSADEILEIHNILMEGVTQ